ncbi:MAG: gamma-glutamyl-gamma-aminobutyrate hydrolase family protein [Rickettsiales bacterium]|nr:gamma-glutamyl-gamma-aminobutyrate hydrolase family protein [Rickettsiales bacterium]
MAAAIEQRNNPLIGVTIPEHGYHWMVFFTKLGVSLAGGIPIELSAHSPKYDLLIDGLVVSGGTDIYPRLYDRKPKLDYHYDHSRDELESRWIRAMEKQGKPILGICRGAQLINVLRGGTLHQDFSKVYEKAQYPSHLLARIFYRKPMQLCRKSKLYKILSCLRCHVNSMHTQSVAKIGESLVVTATEPNGVVQAIEDPNRPMMIGVQFHPEFMLYRKRYRDLFGSLVEVACGESIHHHGTRIHEDALGGYPIYS